MATYPFNQTTPKKGSDGYLWNWLGSPLKKFAQAIQPYISGSGYKVYTALLTQTGTNPPSAIVLENTIGTVTWAYEGLGQYSATFFGYTPQKIVVFTGAGTGGSKTYVIQGYENEYPPYGVWIDTSDSTTGLGLDDVLLLAPIEIRIYP